MQGVYTSHFSRVDATEVRLVKQALMYMHAPYRYTFRAFPKKYCIGRFADVTLGAKVNCVTINTRGFVVDRVTLIEFFNNSNGILNFERIAMHCGLSRVILLLASKLVQPTICET